MEFINGQRVATERQRKLIDILRLQLSLSRDEFAALMSAHTDAETGEMTTKGASAVITELQRRKNALLAKSKIN